LKQDAEAKVRIVEIQKGASLPTLRYRYTSDRYFDVSVVRSEGSWIIKLVLKPFEKEFEKVFEEKLFQDYVDEPRVFAAEADGEGVGWLELGYSKWNNRMIVWELHVKEEFRRRHIGTLLMNRAVEVARERGARMLVLETQSCNVPAIRFYLKFGFELIGLDLAAYSNEDIERREVRLEFGKKL
jgi:ribosomal protein S18 acetylase RimI-like enzyme